MKCNHSLLWGAGVISALALIIEYFFWDYVKFDTKSEFYILMLSIYVIAMLPPYMLTTMSQGNSKAEEAMAAASALVSIGKFVSVILVISAIIQAVG